MGESNEHEFGRDPVNPALPAPDPTDELHPLPPHLPTSPTSPSPTWLALTIGNSRLHWAWFEGEDLRQSWDEPHLEAEPGMHLLQSLEQGHFNPPGLSGCSRVPSDCPLWLASVVPRQALLWQSYRAAHTISLADMPLTGLYPTLGLDRALAVVGAAAVYGLPSLVIDTGTALTFTGADATGHLVGGAILPGLRLQLRSLSETALLPNLADSPPVLPRRWSGDTPGAIWSGVLYTLLAGLIDFVTNWQQAFPTSSILLTGGDAVLLKELLAQRLPDVAAQIAVDTRLIFWGMRQVRSQLI
ncbi:MAG: pantothenate kinase [Elainella sp.]